MCLFVPVCMYSFFYGMFKHVSTIDLNTTHTLVSLMCLTLSSLLCRSVQVKGSRDYMIIQACVMNLDSYNLKPSTMTISMVIKRSFPIDPTTLYFCIIPHLAKNNIHLATRNHFLCIAHCVVHFLVLIQQHWREI